MITSNMTRSGHPSRLIVRQSEKSSGLLTDSVVMTDNIATIHYDEIDRVIETIPDLSELDIALRTTLAL